MFNLSGNSPTISMDEVMAKMFPESIEPGSTVMYGGSGMDDVVLQGPEEDITDVNPKRILRNDDVLGLRSRPEFGTEDGKTLFDKNAVGNDMLFTLITNNCSKCIDAVIGEWRGVDVNTVAEHEVYGNVTPFGFAVVDKKYECAKVFIKHSALKIRKINLGRSTGKSAPLVDAIHDGDVDFVRLLVQHRPSIDLNEDAPLMQAICADLPDMITALIDAGDRVNVNAANEEGQTALHVAVVNDMVDVVESLLCAGANRNCKDMKKKTAMDLARSQKIKDLLNDSNIKKGTKVTKKAVDDLTEEMRKSTTSSSKKPTISKTPLKSSSTFIPPLSQCGMCHSPNEQVSVVVQPCNHLVLCAKCWERAAKMKNYKCPSCKAIVESHFKFDNIQRIVG